MATPKPKKSGKKPAAKTAAKTVKPEKVSTPVAVANKPSNDKPLKGFFARKGDPNENILTIFKSPKIWGALIGEAFGTMLIAMLMLTLGIQPLYLIFALVGVYVVIAGISGAQMNPLVTAGMMATRRMSAIRGVLYILAQLLGAWIGALIVNAFRVGSGSATEAIVMSEISGETFWAVALVELVGAIIIAFTYARSLRFIKKQPLTFAIALTSGTTLAVILGLIIAQSYFGFTNSFAFNPVIALMYQVLPSQADSFGALMQVAGLAIAGYVVFPVIGGILGFFISDLATRLSAGGYATAECDKCCDKE